MFPSSSPPHPGDLNLILSFLLLFESSRDIPVSNFVYKVAFLIDLTSARCVCVGSLSLYRTFSSAIQRKCLFFFKVFLFPQNIVLPSLSCSTASKGELDMRCLSLRYNLTDYF